MNQEENNKDKIIEVNISNEIKTSFLDYSMSVIVSRAIPDVRDGLKPVHRRILYTMFEEGMFPDKKYQKCANAVGNVMGHYHPHGDSAIYESMVRMAQDFTYRHTLIDGHGNFGSIDGDGAAAYRYTEAKLSKISMEMIRDIKKNTVDFVENYDGQRKEPVVLPSRFPNILVNGNMGIAVGMATNIPPHNLGEVIDGCVAYIDNNEIETLELMKYIKGPDFPTSGIILGNSGIKKAYETGKGTITIRSKATIEEKENKSRIVITELPYQVNKSALLVRIRELVRDKQLEGISDLNDESNLEGIKIVIDVKREANANVLLNNLYKSTQLQTTYGINFLMLVAGRPRTLGLKEIIKYYIDYQKEIITRRTKYELDESEKSKHILEGLKIAVDNIDKIIKIIKQSKNNEEAQKSLMQEFKLSEIQTDAILEMKLRRLTGLEREKIEEELKTILNTIKELLEILNSPQKVLGIIKSELLEIKDKYSTPRKTHIDNNSIEYIDDEDLIPIEKIVIAITNKGYIKRTVVDEYKSQNKGGVGIRAMTTNEEDQVENIITGETHDFIMFFTNKGKVYRIKGYEIPEYGRQAKGIPIVNLLPVDKEEKITSILISPRNEDNNNKLVIATKQGSIKRCNTAEFDSIRNNGKIAISLKENDEVIGVHITDGEQEVVMATSDGKVVRFKEQEVRTMGRTASGVRAINLNIDQNCIGFETARGTEEILIVTEKGYGKRTNIDEYRITRRGSKGVKALNVTEKNGKLVSFNIVDESNELLVINDIGTIIRVPIERISKMSRVTQGVRIINLKEESKVVSTSIVESE